MLFIPIRFCLFHKSVVNKNFNIKYSFKITQ